VRDFIARDVRELCDALERACGYLTPRTLHSAPGEDKVYDEAVALLERYRAAWYETSHEDEARRSMRPCTWLEDDWPRGGFRARLSCILRGHDLRLVWPPLCMCTRCGKSVA